MSQRSHSTPPATPGRPPVSQMSPDQLHTWLRSTKAQLLAHMQWERAYLDRRARRSVHTSTDEMGQQGLAVEADLLTLVEELIHTHEADQEGGAHATTPLR
jgi:hypothetical protein